MSTSTKRKAERTPKKGKQTDMAAWSKAAYHRNDRISREDRTRAPDEPMSDEKELKQNPK